jgi:hypothetical protein
VEVARQDGYDLVLWSGPAAGGMIQTRTYLGRNVSAERKARYPAFGYVVRGYRSDGSHPPSAQPVGTAIGQINGEIAKKQKLSR